MGAYRMLKCVSATWCDAIEARTNYLRRSIDNNDASGEFPCKKMHKRFWNREQRTVLLSALRVDRNH